jgi:hypothetical protein
LVALVALLLTCLACSSDADEGDEAAGAGGDQGPALEGCGPLEFGEVRGRTPAYLEPPLDRFPNDHALCDGLWVNADEGDFVPQSLTMRDRTAWVGGYDDGPVGMRTCRVLRIDLGTGRVLTEAAPIVGSVGARPEIDCRHGGGLAVTDVGLWLAESDRLWLLDPESLSVQRVWAIERPVRGSFAVTAPNGRIGLGEFRFERRAHFYWFDPVDLVSGGDIVLSPEDSVGTRMIPARAQGGVVADLGPGPAKLWIVTSNTTCGVLAGPGGRRIGFLPGAEGTKARGNRLWTVTESSSRPYQEKGGRPVVPTLAQFDISEAGRWQDATCSP